MRFQGNSIDNLIAAAKSKDEILVRDLIVDEMANAIQNNPKEMIKTLRNSNVRISDNASLEKLVDVASYNLHNNLIFQKNLAVSINNKYLANSETYANGEGDGGSGDGGGKGGGGNIVASIASMIGSIGQFGAAKNDLKAEELRTKSKMYEKIFGGDKKTNWLPIVAIGGVFLIAALVVWKTTSNK
jgi:hypothetical protein